MWATARVSARGSRCRPVVHRPAMGSPTCTRRVSLVAMGKGRRRSRETPDEPDEVRPVDVDGVRVIAVLTVGWAVAFVALAFAITWLDSRGRGWWLWTCLAGVGLGLLGLEYARKRRDAIALAREAEESDDDTADAPQARDEPGATAESGWPERQPPPADLEPPNGPPPGIRSAAAGFPGPVTDLAVDSGTSHPLASPPTSRPVPVLPPALPPSAPSRARPPGSPTAVTQRVDIRGDAERDTSLDRSLRSRAPDDASADGTHEGSSARPARSAGGSRPAAQRSGLPASELFGELDAGRSARRSPPTPDDDEPLLDTTLGGGRRARRYDTTGEIDEITEGGTQYRGRRARRSDSA